MPMMIHNLDPYPGKTTVRFFPSGRLFNVCFSIEDLQGDGFIRLTIGLFYRSIQLVIPFNNKRHLELDFRLFGRKRLSK